MAIATRIALSILVVILALQAARPVRAHNITKILAQHPSFSSFNHYLSLTHLAAEINRRRTITVLALDNAAMSDITSRGYSLYTIRNILSLHVLVDYFGKKKLHKISNHTTITSSLFQATGLAPGFTGYVNMTDLGGKKVGFTANENTGDVDFTSFFVKSVVEKPYNISVIQISHALSSAEADAPTPAPSSLHLPSVLSSKGCKAFAALLDATNATLTFQDSIDAGLTVLCATDAAVKAFMPKYKALSKANRRSVLLYHGIPSYNSMGMLQTSNAVMNTLATKAAGKFDFTVSGDGNSVSLDTTVVTAKITGTLLDEDPLSIYKVNKMLLPKEFFKAAEAPAPESEEEDDGDDVADQKNGALGVDGGGLTALVVGVIGSVMLMFV